MCGRRGAWALRSVRVAVSRSCSVWNLQWMGVEVTVSGVRKWKCVGNEVYGLYAVRECWYVEVAVFGICVV